MKRKMKIMSMNIIMKTDIIKSLQHHSLEIIITHLIYFKLTMTTHRIWTTPYSWMTWKHHSPANSRTYTMRFQVNSNCVSSEMMKCSRELLKNHQILLALMAMKTTSLLNLKSHLLIIKMSSEISYSQRLRPQIMWGKLLWITIGFNM
jgi:hypothetical protein